MSTQEEMLTEIYSRVQAMAQAPTEAQVRTWIQESFTNLMDDKEFVRKMKFGAGGETPSKMVGTKFARWGLTVEDVEWLYDFQQSLIGQKRVNGGGVYQGPSQELRQTFEGISRAYYLTEAEVRELDTKALDDVFPRLPLRAFGPLDQVLLERGGKAKNGEWVAIYETDAYQRAYRAMDTAESGYGNQLIGAQYVGDLWEGARAQSRIFSLFQTFEMTAPTAYLPVEADLPEMLFVSENTANNSSNYTTSKTGSNRATVTAKKFVMHQMWSGELEEDSIIPFVPFIRRQAAKSLSHYPDSVILNGDTTNAGTGNINLDDADPADTKHYLAFDGLRHAGIVDNTGNSSNHAGANISLEALRGAYGRMLDATYLMDWGHPTDPMDLVRIGDPETCDRIVTLDDVITAQQIQNRPLLNGEVGAVLGNPLISSIAMSKTEADGKVSTTAGNNTLGQLVTLNRRGGVVGWRRRVVTETERLPATDQTRIVHSLRMGFGRFSPTGAASGIEWADVLYNIGL